MLVQQQFQTGGELESAVLLIQALHCGKSSSKERLEKAAISFLSYWHQAETGDMKSMAHTNPAQDVTLRSRSMLLEELPCEAAS